MRKNEGKDGNALNEVRMITDSILENGGVLAANSTIKYTPETAVLGLAVGDEITVDADGFARLLDAFLARDRDPVPVTVRRRCRIRRCCFVLRAWSGFTAEPMWRTQRLTLVPVSAAR